MEQHELKVIELETQLGTQLEAQLLAEQQTLKNLPNKSQPWPVQIMELVWMDPAASNSQLASMIKWLCSAFAAAAVIQLVMLYQCVRMKTKKANQSASALRTDNERLQLALAVTQGNAQDAARTAEQLSSEKRAGSETLRKLQADLQSTEARAAENLANRAHQIEALNARVSELEGSLRVAEERAVEGAMVSVESVTLKGEIQELKAALREAETRAAEASSVTEEMSALQYQVNHLKVLHAAEEQARLAAESKVKTVTWAEDKAADKEELRLSQNATPEQDAQPVEENQGADELDEQVLREYDHEQDKSIFGIMCCA
ncbi:hypothetical protein CYMTET_32493 [Cymbomonas tetramitiformis]|uniref:Uncharacterized protein n=1 Tax=Cymbomonas tetramitiformis TaxID=36881 RepID=A0AAE0FEY8_9CHLO|nr:hypothetical protein CYMTET_32493 [Cymbomonas tetramitiformis]